jgi:hypothetical protein
MATRQHSRVEYHTCTCGEGFDTTEELLEHARDAHGIGVC